MEKEKKWTPYQLNRLAPRGYYIHHYGTANLTEKFSSFIYVGRKTCTYFRWDFQPYWGTLSWVAAPTKKKISKVFDDDAYESRYYHFDTYNELKAFIKSYNFNVYPGNAPNENE